MKLLKPKINIKIKAAENYTPQEHAYTNSDIISLHPSTKILPSFLKNKLGKSITKKFGFSVRHMIRKPGAGLSERLSMSCEDMSLKCLKKAYKEDMGEIDYFVMGSTTSSRYTGSQATSILSQVNQYSPAIEVKAGCSTSLASLYTGVLALSAGHENAMIICSETMSALVNPKIRETWFGLGDGSACLWMQRCEKEAADFEVKAMTFGTDGRHVNLYTTQGKFPPNTEDLEGNGYVLSGDGDQLRSLSIKYYTEMLELFDTEFDLSTITHIIPHQVNNSIITEITGKYFNEKLIVLKNNLEVGNIGGTSVLYTLTDSLKSNKFKAGDRILMLSVGGGLSYSMHLWQKL